MVRGKWGNDVRRIGLSVICLALALCGPKWSERAGAQVSDYRPISVPNQSSTTAKPSQSKAAVQPTTEWKWEPARSGTVEGPIVPVQNIVMPPRNAETKASEPKKTAEPPRAAECP